eukprot:scaffold140403_cov13-Tisochrysis_lutea.AAC.1
MEGHSAGITILFTLVHVEQYSCSSHQIMYHPSLSALIILLYALLILVCLSRQRGCQARDSTSHAHPSGLESALDSYPEQELTRKTLALQEILHWNPDIICAQEVGSLKLKRSLFSLTTLARNCFIVAAVVNKMFLGIDAVYPKFR